jgi:hypothetical protein
MGRSSAALCLAATALLSCCASGGRAGGGGADRLPLNGMVYDYESKPVSDAEIRVDGKLASRSDINGRFSLGAMPFGTYKLAAGKAGFETTNLDVAYTDIAQIIYLKIYSVKQLVSAAEKEAGTRSWNGALGYLDRVSATGSKDPAARFLRAVVLARKGEAKAARPILESLLAEDYDEPYVHLFLADILQYSLGDSKAAIYHLEKYLRSRYDPDIEDRLQKIKNNAPGE